MTKLKKEPAYSSDELLRALEICKRSSRSSLTTKGLNSGYLFWRSQRWLDVDEHFGSKKSKSLFTALEGILENFRDVEKAYLLRVRNDGDLRAEFNWCRPIVKAFRKKYPNVPSEILLRLEADFMFRHR